MDTNAQLTALAVRLARSAPRLLTNGDLDPFYEALDEVLALDSPDDEMLVMGAVVDELRERFGAEAGELVSEMLREFEVESEQFDGETQDGLRRCCIVFAIPFVNRATETVPTRFRQPADVRELEAILRESQVISEVADFRLVPRVFSTQDLYGRTFSEYAHLTRHWCGQLLTEGEVDGVGLPLLTQPAPGVQSLPQANNPFVQLHFLVGVLAARESDLPDVFPGPTLREVLDGDDDEKPQDVIEDMPDDPFEKEPEVGFLSEDLDWEEAFLDELALALELMSPPLAAVMPCGLHEDLSSGIALEREVGLQHQISTTLSNHELEVAHVYAERRPALGQSGESYGWLVSLVVRETGDVLEEIEWPELGHESAEECAFALEMALKVLGVEGDEVSEMLTSNRTLH